MAGLVTASRAYPTCGKVLDTEVGQARLPMPSTSCLRSRHGCPA